MRRTFKAYAVQFETAECDFEWNYSRFLSLLNFCERNSLVVAPEVFSTGFCYGKVDEAIEFSERVCKELLEFSRGLEVTLVFTAFERVNGKLFNCVKVFDRGKEVLSRPKIKLFPLTGEVDYFTAGSLEDLKIAETSLGVLAPVICFEMRFYPVLERLKVLGGEVFTVSAQWGRGRKFHWEIFVKTRAVEFQRFFVAANGTGKEMAGSSLIVDPWGRVLSEAGDSEGVISGVVDTAVVFQVERKLPLN